MRILVIADFLANAVTGVERYTFELTHAIARRSDVDLSVLVRDARHAHLLDRNISVVVSPPFANLGLLGYWLSPPLCLDDYDLVHCPTVRTPFLLRPRRAKLVMTVHDLVPLVTPQHHRLAYRVYFRHVLPHLAWQCDALIADSDSTASDIVQILKMPEERIHTVPLAGRWQVDAAARYSHREPFVLAVGTLEPRKNLRRIAEAFLQVKATLPRGRERLIIAGGRGWGKTRLDCVLRQRADIQWQGYVSDEELERLYREAKMLVYPSLYEGFGLPVLEAMSLGCPVISSNRSSLPEVGGDAVIYVNPESTDQIADAMATLLANADLWHRMSARGLKQAAKFSWDITAARTVEVYRKVLDGSD